MEIRGVLGKFFQKIKHCFAKEQKKNPQINQWCLLNL